MLQLQLASQAMLGLLNPFRSSSASVEKPKIVCVQQGQLQESGLNFKYECIATNVAVVGFLIMVIN